jgi:hypothetical protein
MSAFAIVLSVGLALSLSTSEVSAEESTRGWFYGSVGKGGSNKNNRVLLYDNPAAEVKPNDASNTINGNSRATGTEFKAYTAEDGVFPKKVYMEPDAGTKYTEGHNGFTYFFTEIEPDNENWTIEGDIKIVDRVNDAQIIDNQSAFGIIATDIAPKLDANPYFNSITAGFGRHRYLRDGTYTTVQGAPGIIVKTGFTDSSGMSAPDGLDSYGFDTECFDPDFNIDYKNLKFSNDDGAATDYPVRWKVGDIYRLRLKKDSSGFRAELLSSIIDGKEIKYEYPMLTCYEPDLLRVQDKDRYYVGFFASRKIAIEVSGISFESHAPDPIKDGQKEERPKKTVLKTLTLDSGIYSGSENYKAGFYSNVTGKFELRDDIGNTIETGNITANKRLELSISLDNGENKFKAVIYPAAREKQTALPSEYFDFSDYEPIYKSFSVTMKEIAPVDQTIYASIKGSPNGSGTREDPVTLKTALNYAKPGQQIVAMKGKYYFKTCLTIPRGNDGATLIGEPGAIFDLSNSKNGGLIIRGSDWHIYNIEICNSKVLGKPIYVQGNRNRIEKVYVHDVADSGISLSGSSYEPFEMWPRDNYFVSCHARNCVDAMRNNADGYAMKLTVGNGNKLKYCIASFNIDDGYDLFAQSSTGPIGAIEIDSCISYGNGLPTYDYDENGGSFAEAKQIAAQGFKLGGSHILGTHTITNSISFLNYGDGISSNSGAGVRAYKNTLFRNGRGLRFYTNYEPENDDEKFEAVGNLLIESGDIEVDKEKSLSVSYISGDIDIVNVPEGLYVPERGTYKDTDQPFIDFFNPENPFVEPSFKPDGTIDMHGFLQPNMSEEERGPDENKENTGDSTENYGADFSNLQPDSERNPLTDLLLREHSKKTPIVS